MKTVGKFGGMTVLSAILVSGIGCSDLPDLGTVTGTVTFDGKPAINKVVAFHSVDGGRPGAGVTDSDGKYELTYRSGVKGTKVGPVRVEVSTQWPEGEPPEGEVEEIPIEYNSKTILKFTVKSGENTFDLPLTSDGSPLK